MKKISLAILGIWLLYTYMLVMTFLTKRRVWTIKGILTISGLAGLAVFLLLVTLTIFPAIILEWKANADRY